MLLYPAECL